MAPCRRGMDPRHCLPLQRGASLLGVAFEESFDDSLGRQVAVARVDLDLPGDGAGVAPVKRNDAAISHALGVLCRARYEVPVLGGLEALVPLADCLDHLTREEQRMGPDGEPAK